MIEFGWGRDANVSGLTAAAADVLLCKLPFAWLCEFVVSRVLAPYSYYFFV